MILTDTPFTTLNNLILEDEQNNIEFILIDFQYEIINNKIQLSKQFIPIYSDIRIKKINSAVQIGSTQQQLKDVLGVSLALVVYDKKRYYQLKNSNIEEIVLQAIRNAGNQERYDRVIESLNKNNIDISNYNTIDNEKFMNILSSTLYAQSIYKNVITEFSKLNEHFLKKEQVEDIVKSLDEFNPTEDILSNVKKRQEYIANLYKEMDKTSLYVHPTIEKNILFILKKYDVYDILKHLFFDEIDEEEFLSKIENIFYRKIIPTPSTKEIMQEIYELIYKNILHNSNEKVHVSAKNIRTEVLNNIRFVNLYNYDDNYGVELYSQSLEKLYKRMKENRLSKIQVSNNPFSYYKQKLDESVFYKSKMSNIKLEQASSIILEMQSNYDGISDMNTYKQDYITSKIQTESFYKEYMDNNNITNPTERSLIDAKTEHYQQIYKDNFLFEHYKLEKEFESTIVKEYVKTSKKELQQEDKEDEYITQLRAEIPTTKRVRGKVKKLKKGEVEDMLQEKITIYKTNENNQKSQKAFEESLDAEISTEIELDSIIPKQVEDDAEIFSFIDDFNKTKNSKDLFYNIMELGLKKD